MIRRPPRSTRTDTLFPYTTLFRSKYVGQTAIRLSYKSKPRCDTAGFVWPYETPDGDRRRLVPAAQLAKLARRRCLSSQHGQLGFDHGNIGLVLDRQSTRLNSSH